MKRYHRGILARNRPWPLRMKAASEPEFSLTDVQFQRRSFKGGAGKAAPFFDTIIKILQAAATATSAPLRGGMRCLPHPHRRNQAFLISILRSALTASGFFEAVTLSTPLSNLA